MVSTCAGDRRVVELVEILLYDSADYGTWLRWNRKYCQNTKSRTCGSADNGLYAPGTGKGTELSSDDFTPCTA